MNNTTAPVYRVTVGNIGEVYAGNSAAEARATFNIYKAQSLANEGRAAAEIVTLWENGEPSDEFVPVVYDLELTDTYAGEANYSWVKRAALVYATEPTDRALILAAKRALGLTGIKCTREDWPDTGATIQLDPRGLCQRAFITRRDV